MVPINPVQTPEMADIAAIQNRVAVALAKRERLIKSWTASSSRPRPPPKTQQELDAEDADLFRIEPPTLGLGAPLPKEFVDGDVRRKEISGNDSLRRLLMGKKAGLQASKPRDSNEKAGSTKRTSKEESSDEEEGRSALGKAKKSKTGTNSPMKYPVAKEEAKTAIKEVKNILWEIKPAAQDDIQPAIRNIVAPGPRVLSQKTFKPQFRPAVTTKKCLVDYSSDDGDVSELTNKASIGSTPQKALFKIPSPYDIPEDSVNPPANTLSKSASGLRSKTSSKSSKTSSDSDQSELETAIPMSLTSDVVAPVSLSLAKNNLSDEAKRAKKRQKRARRKEKEQQLKMLAQSQTSGMTQMQAVTSTTGLGVSKKLKDRLLDANGN